VTYERRLNEARDHMADARVRVDAERLGRSPDAGDVAIAQVHATLAQAAATLALAELLERRR